MSQQQPITDRFGRRITYLRVSITDRCNMRCIYCAPKKVEFLPASEILTLEEIARAVEIAVRSGINKIRLTGGEPLSRPNVLKIITDIAAIPGINDFSLTTNGLTLSEFAHQLKTAGLHRINISLDTLNPQRFKEICGGGDPAQVMDGIDAAISSGLNPVKVNVVVMRGVNHTELEAFVRLSLEKGVTVRFIEFMPFKKDKQSAEKFMPRSEILKQISPWLDSETESNPANNEPARYYSLKGGAAQIGIISPVSHSFCSACNRLRLTPQGGLRGCLLSEESVDIKSLLRNGAPDNEIAGAFRKAAGQKGEKGDFANVKSPMHKIGG